VEELDQLDAELKEKPESGASCVISLLGYALGPWLVSLIAIPLTGSLAESLAWISARSPLSDAWTPYFTFTAVFLAGLVLISTLRLAHAESSARYKDAVLWASCIDMLMVFVLVRAAGHPNAGWLSDNLNLFYSSSGVWGKLVTSPVILILHFILCGWVSWLAVRCFLAMVRTPDIYIGDPEKILAGRKEQPWHDRVREHICEAGVHSETGPDFLTYTPSMIVLAIVYRSNPFLLTALACLIIARAATKTVTEFISMWLDWRSDRLAKKLCMELVDPPYASSRLAAITKLAKMFVGNISGQAEISAMLDDSDPAVRQAAAEAMEKIEGAWRARAAWLTRIGKTLCEADKFTQAMGIYDKAIETYSDDGHAYYCRGQAHQKQSKHDEAIADYSEAIRLDPKNALYLNDRGRSHFANGDHQAAIDDYSASIALEPEGVKAADVHLLRSKAYAAIGDYDNAWSDIRTCRKLGGHVNAKFLTRLRKNSQQDE
jgi:tetratricopeptide (TPR) repeat protein